MSRVPCSRLSRALADRFGTPETAVPDRQRKNAAVAVVARPPPGADDPPVADCDLLLIRRAVSPRDPWSGQMALPGGRLDAADPTLVAAAVRETQEETGVALNPAPNLVGRLPAVRPASVRIPSVTIWPFVFQVESGAQARVASPEVAAVHWFSVRALSDPRTRGRYRPSGAGKTGETDSFPCIRLDGQVVWGLTYRVLETFLRVCA